MTERPDYNDDVRPYDCRFRCQDEGRPYPRSSCSVCHRTITTGLSNKCQRQIDKETLPDKETLSKIKEQFDTTPSKLTFNRLTPRQNEILSMLAEEAAEIVQQKEKTVRHGLDSYHPRHPERGDNRARLSREIGDLLGVVDEAIRQGILDESAINIYRSTKMKRAAPYLHHQAEIIQ